MQHCGETVTQPEGDCRADMVFCMFCMLIARKTAPLEKDAGLAESCCHYSLMHRKQHGRSVPFPPLNSLPNATLVTQQRTQKMRFQKQTEHLLQCDTLW